MTEVINNIKQWGVEKGIIPNASPEAQMLKTVEEVGELANAIGKYDLLEVADAIGDIVVTLVLQAELQGLYFEKCVEGAYDVIAKRTGKMENGIFVKDA